MVLKRIYSNTMMLVSCENFHYNEFLKPVQWHNSRVWSNTTCGCLQVFFVWWWSTVSLGDIEQIKVVLQSLYDVIIKEWKVMCYLPNYLISPFIFIPLVYPSNLIYLSKYSILPHEYLPWYSPSDDIPPFLGCCYQCKWFLWYLWFYTLHLTPTTLLGVFNIIIKVLSDHAEEAPPLVFICFSFPLKYRVKGDTHIGGGSNSWMEKYILLSSASPLSQYARR